jgi:hypothetical protein
LATPVAADELRASASPPFEEITPEELEEMEAERERAAEEKSAAVKKAAAAQEAADAKALQEADEAEAEAVAKAEAKQAAETAMAEAAEESDSDGNVATNDNDDDDENDMLSLLDSLDEVCTSKYTERLPLSRTNCFVSCLTCESCRGLFRQPPLVSHHRRPKAGKKSSLPP